MSCAPTGASYSLRNIGGQKQIFTRENALQLLYKYKNEPFHIRHALTVEAVMRWYAHDLGFSDEADFWALVGLLHDVDFEAYPEQHCRKAPELLAEIGASQRLIRAVCSHGWSADNGLPQPEHAMEKVLYAADELTGLIGAAVLCGPPNRAGHGGQICAKVQGQGLCRRMLARVIARRAAVGVGAGCIV